MAVLTKSKGEAENEIADFGTFRYGEGASKYEKAALNNKLPSGIIRIYPEKFAVSTGCSKEFALVVYEEDNTRLRFSRSKEELDLLLIIMKPFQPRIVSSKRKRYGNRYFFDTRLYERHGEGRFSLLSDDDAFMKIGGRT